LAQSGLARRELEDRIEAAEAAAEEIDDTRDALRAEFPALAENWYNELAALADELGDIARERYRERLFTAALVNCERDPDKPLH
jgi:hypothetical protein